MNTRGIGKLLLVQLKLFLREPPAFFFTLIFPAMLLVLFATIFGNEPGSDYQSAFGYVDAQVPGFTGIILASIAFMGIPIATAAQREHGVLRRYRATPLSPVGYLVADVGVNYVMAAVGMAILIAVGRVFYGLRFEGAWLSVIAGFTLCALSFFSAGYLVASVASNARTAQVIGQVLFFPMMFLSGATLPLAMMPASLRNVSDALPLTHAVNLLRGLWFGEPWGAYVAETAILVIVLVTCVSVCTKVFRWE